MNRIKKSYFLHSNIMEIFKLILLCMSFINKILDENKIVLYCITNVKPLRWRDEQALFKRVPKKINHLSYPCLSINSTIFSRDESKITKTNIIKSKLSGIVFFVQHSVIFEVYPE